MLKYKYLLLYSIAFFLLVFGYIFPYSDINGLSFIFISFVWVILIKLLLKDINQLINFYFFLVIFFPQKPISPSYPFLFNELFSFTDATFSIYNYILFLAFFPFIRNSEKLNKYKNLYIVVILLIFSGLVGLLKAPFILHQFGISDILRMLFNLSPFLGVYFILKFTEKIDFKKLLENISIYSFMMGLILLVEFLFSNILPSSLSLFSFDYRGGFRSIFLGYSVTAGFMLVLSTMSSLYYYAKTRKKIYLIFALIFTVVSFYTFERSAVSVCLVSFFYFFFLDRKKITLVLTTVILVFFVSSEIIDTLEISQKKSEGFLGTNSTWNRVGTDLRAVDIFLAYPITGVGVSNTIYFTGDNSISATFGTGIFQNTQAQQFYYQVVGGMNTLPHTYYFNLISDFGIFGLLFSIYIIYYVLRKLFSKTKFQMSRLQIYAKLILISLMIYYFFQPVPNFIQLIIVSICYLGDGYSDSYEERIYESTTIS